MSMKEKVLNVLIFITTTLAMYALFAYMSETLHDSQVTQVSSQVPSRSIQWGDFNFLHTTDTHGWLAGHRKRSYPELNGSGDWGDYASFVDRMRSTAENRGVELFVVDSGDLHDGSGLSDAYKRGDVNGHQTNAIFAMLDIDVLTIGNHGLYDADVTLDIYKHFVPKWNKRYLTSNTFIKDPDADADVAELIPIGEKYRKFTTALGNKVTAFGVMFDFPWPNWRAHVQPIEDMVKEPWFDEATEEAPEFFLIAAHMAINDAKWSVLIDALKSKHPHTPVISFGGHQHIRDCVFNYADERDVRMASGRFLETVGWMGVNITHDGQIEVGRRYLDATPQGYAWHLGIRQRDVLTHQGKRIKKEISKLWHRFNLGKRVGYIDRDLYQNRVPASHPDSLTRWMRDSVLPTISASDRDGVPKLVLMNSGAIRFDLYQGEVTKNDMYTAFPFKNTLPYVRDVPYPVAKGLLHTLNNLPGHPFAAYSAGGAVDSARSTSPSVGYVTNDTCPGIPDDTDHTPLAYYDQPPCFSTELEALDDDALVDVVFLSFLQPSIEKALHILTPHVQYTIEETYTSHTIREVVEEYLRKTSSTH